MTLQAALISVAAFGSLAGPAQPADDFVAPALTDALAPASVALTMDPPAHAPAHGRRAKGKRIYDDRGYYLEPRRITRSSYVWRGRDGKYYCKRDNGTTGLVIGAGVGALAGHELAGRGDKTLGALLGAAIGGVIGREIDRGNLRCR
ncbi:glycine zipper 2TM domain-containing protein [Erythrobacter sp. GH1-10]|uniref:glycine zipper 2TM domain-containing protein n=1 Tax=Erythrobacter sp. GH1-10 TaxID=3349334 RepID=UPI003878230C